ncbi:Zinc finger protein [Plakobranchus ocellatus]|uniref:Zinc finger protein n=1 Tax=Plakobranchus ocellatus TaxID=259542 RepID=A0AAV3Y1H1_9GAST|nr:Zinc finger protein [Plakobranchus ocellatus]
MLLPGTRRTSTESQNLDHYFDNGDKVLLLLPTRHNKLELKWHGPFEIVNKSSSYNYTIDIYGTRKTYHVNLLKRYHEMNGSAPTLRWLKKMRKKELKLLRLCWKTLF